MTFDEIESCFPDGGTDHDGKITVSAQWLHDFAANLQKIESNATLERMRLRLDHADAQSNQLAEVLDENERLRRAIREIDNYLDNAPTVRAIARAALPAPDQGPQMNGFFLGDHYAEVCGGGDCPYCKNEREGRLADPAHNA